MSGRSQVLPLQGRDIMVGLNSQGVALGCRVVAPLARNKGVVGGGAGHVYRQGAIDGGVGHAYHAGRMQSIVQPEGRQPFSPGQRPGNPVTTMCTSPERAKPKPGSFIFCPWNFKTSRCGLYFFKTAAMAFSVSLAALFITSLMTPPKGFAMRPEFMRAM